MMIEFWLATWNNVNAVAGMLVALAVGCAVVSGMAFLFFRNEVKEFKYERDVENMTKAWRYFWRSILVMAVALVISVLPSSGNLWAARIDMIKLELASPENLAAGRDRINEIVRGLECKHLGQNCPKEK